MRTRPSLGFLPLVCMTGLIGGAVGVAHADPVELTDLSSPYTQDFDSLASTTGVSASSPLPLGWAFVEAGGNATYRVGTGSDNSGDTYSFGAASSTERAFGSLNSNSNTPTIGASFRNGSNTTINTLKISFTGEQWRLGATGRDDRLEFAYSADATALNSTGSTWTAVTELNFVAPVTSGTLGALLGNTAAAQRSVTFTITGLSIAPDATFWIRWSDYNADGSDDGIAIDDFRLEATGSAASNVDLVKIYDAGTYPLSGDVVDVGLLVENRETATIYDVVITDLIPAGLTALDDNFTVDLGAGPVTLTTAIDSDAGQIVAGVVTVTLDEMTAGQLVEVTYQATIESLAVATTFGGIASATYALTDGGAALTTTGTDAFDAFLGGALSFFVFFDTNGNGTKDDGETGLPDWEFLITGSDVVTTTDNGLATFAGLVPGAVDVIVAAAAADGAWGFTDVTTATATEGQNTQVLIAVTCSCNDNNLCTTTDSCDRGVCSFTGALDCGTSDDPCVTNSCDPTDGCGQTFTTAACDDGDDTTRSDMCDGAGGCEGVGYTCTAGSCEVSSTPNGVGCDVVRQNVGATCDDGDTTTRADMCGLTGPCAGTPIVCQPTGNPCINNVPNGNDCTPTPVNPGGACTDGNAMTRNDTCDDEGACTGETYECPASTNPCIDNVENGATCTPTPINIGGTCNDGSMTTNNDVCSAAGVCAGTPFTCPVSTNPCITNVANGTDCTATPTNVGGSCDDGVSTTRLDVCSAAGDCAGTSYTCTPSTDPCMANVANGVDCTPTPTNLGGSCDDSMMTTRDDVCTAAGACVGTAYTCDAPSNPCLANTANGTDCTTAPANSGGSCDDGDATTRADVCNAVGVCAGVGFTCDAPANVCKVSTPNGAICVESNGNEGGDCDDGDNATTDDVCAAGVCVGTAYNCVPGPCEATSVPNGEGCDVTFKAASTECDDANSSTRTDVCDGAGGCFGTAYTCEAGPCEATSVPNGTDCSVTFKADTEVCDDGSLCTTNDMCNGSGLCEGEVISCDDGFSCDPTGECIATHCTSCGVDDGCGNASLCVDVGGETGKVCLLSCELDTDCAEEQVCRTLGEAGMFCFDLEGQCEAPPVEPGPDAEVEQGPESVPVEPGPEALAEAGPEVAEGGPDSAAEVVEGEVIWSGGGSGCSGGSPAGAGLLLLALVALALGASRKRFN